MATSVSGTSFVNGKVEDMARVLMTDKRVEAIVEYGVLNGILFKSLNMHLTMEEEESNVECGNVDRLDFEFPKSSLTSCIVQISRDLHRSTSGRDVVGHE